MSLPSGAMIEALVVESGKTVTLGGSTVINGDLDLSAGGTLNIAGKTLTLKGNIIMSSNPLVGTRLATTGSIVGGTGSTLIVESAGCVIPSISNGLGNLTINENATLSADLTVASDVTINGTSVLTIDNGVTLTVEGSIAAPNGGGFDGGNDGNLVIAGSGQTAVTLPAKEQSFGALTVTRPSGIVLAENINVHNDITLNPGGINNDGNNIITKGTIIGTGQITGSGWVKFQSKGGSSVRPLPGRTYNKLELDDSQGFEAAADVTVTGTLNLKSGHFNIGTKTLDLGTTGTITGESTSNRINGTTGKIRSQRSVAANTTVSFGNGVSINAGNNANLGTTVVAERGFEAVTRPGASSINRRFAFTGLGTPTNSMSIDFHYSDDELNGISENLLSVFASTNEGASWYEPVSQQRHTSSNYITVTFTSNFSKAAMHPAFRKASGVASTLNDSPVLLLTGGEAGGALPVELVSFSGMMRNEKVQLAWKTATETNNYGFEVERAAVVDPKASVENAQWSTIGFVAGNGTTSSERSYSFSDDVSAGALRQVAHFAYRLRQIDRDGTTDYSPVVFVSRSVQEPVALALDMPYPNPTENESFATVRLAESRIATVQLVSVDGKVLETIAADQQLDAGVHSFRISRGTLPAGVYFVVVQSAELRVVRPLTIVR